jgi:GTP-binding protein YchF
MRTGIIGLPATGKTTLFNLLSAAGGGHVSSHGANEPSVVAVKIPDQRLERLASLIFKPRKVTHATLEFVDFVALTRGAGKGEGLGSHFMSQMRQVDVLLHILRDFEDPRIPHVEGKVDPARDAVLVNTELLLADLDTVEKRIARLEADLKKIKKEEAIRELDLLKRCRVWLADEKPLRELPLTADEEKALRGFALLTAKPMLLLLNIGEAKLGKPNPTLDRLQRALGGKGIAVTQLCVKVEWEVVQLPPEDAEAFRKDLGLPAGGFVGVLRACMDLLGLITFYTGEGGEETRAWLVPGGATALKAAGTVHSDLERGFIRAEVIPFPELEACGSLAGAKKKGLLRLEGKEYRVADGDVIAIRFNV